MNPSPSATIKQEADARVRAVPQQVAQMTIWNPPAPLPTRADLMQRERLIPYLEASPEAKDMMNDLLNDIRGCYDEMKKSDAEKKMLLEELQEMKMKVGSEGQDHKLE